MHYFYEFLVNRCCMSCTIFIFCWRVLLLIVIKTFTFGDFVLVSLRNFKIIWHFIILLRHCMAILILEFLTVLTVWQSLENGCLYSTQSPRNTTLYIALINVHYTLVVVRMLACVQQVLAPLFQFNGSCSLCAFK